MFFNERMRFCKLHIECFTITRHVLELHIGCFKVTHLVFSHTRCVPVFVCVHARVRAWWCVVVRVRGSGAWWYVFVHGGAWWYVFVVVVLGGTCSWWWYLVVSIRASMYVRVRAW